MNRQQKPRRRRTPPSAPTTTEQDDEDEDDPSTDTRRRTYSGDVADDEEGTTPATGTEASYSDRPSPAPATTNSSWCSSGAAPPSTPPTYVNVAPLPVFRGGPGECPVAHLRRFARVCRANNALAPETMARIFPVTLDAEAALWYELEVEPHPDLSWSWEEMSTSFLRAYCRPESVERSRSELMAMKQGGGEGVNAYYLRMQWVLRKWPGHGVPDAMLRGIFVDGLKEDYQDWIVPQQPNSLEAAFRLALSWERAKGVRAARGRVESPASGSALCGFCDGQHEEGSCDVRRRMRELWLRSRERPDQTRMGNGGGGEVAAPPGPGNLRSLSLSASMGRTRGGEGKEGVGLLSWKKSPQCQCSLHQCWKKYERSNSGLPEGNPHGAAD